MYVTCALVNDSVANVQDIPRWHFRGGHIKKIRVYTFFRLEGTSITLFKERYEKIKFRVLLQLY